MWKMLLLSLNIMEEEEDDQDRPQWATCMQSKLLYGMYMLDVFFSF